MQQLFTKKIYVFDVDNTLIDWSNLKTLFHDMSYTIQMGKVQKRLNQRRGLRDCPGLRISSGSPPPLHPILLEFLQHLQAKREPIIIFSDLPHPELNEIYDQLGIQVIINGQDIASTKPLPDGLWQIASQYGVSTTQIIFIGDQDKTDFRSAINAGAHYYSVEELKQIGWEEFYARLT